ncbi:prephenate/arogenate dehydrogenase family protein [Kordiimonas sp. SCSIO 12603]|uniref:prephenate/arogenate dehydrogenase family protein n=1 Tax=Kordiimonas sp. SCSIO 12603 TaxID=2829596 RepID=UPI002103E5AB|nr:prephenate/arogenate dehydrogenase family protein [Kordiimonas sp. SCSIO 12603]UTW58494.1 prephenate/arogenate dehydrogenase family protein [Kordiimonas sp. SCSIO 12603]
MTATDSIFNRITIVGAGLIGSSVARAVRKYEVCETLALVDANEAIISEARDLELADEYYTDVAKSVDNSDLIMLAVPVGAMASVGAAIAGNLKAGAIISDVGSVKESVFKALDPLLPEGVHLIPGHPVAGTEQSGPSAGFATLFDDRWCIITPPEGADEAALEKLSALWKAFGSRVEIMTPQHHDLVLAITSHVPHLIAYNIVGTASDLEEVTRSEVIKYSAGGFRDFTRIAASDPTMWRDVFLNNKDAVLEMLGRFSEDLTALQRAIRWGDGDALFDLFTRTRGIRRRIIDAGQDDAAADFGRTHED